MSERIKRVKVLRGETLDELLVTVVREVRHVPVAKGRMDRMLTDGGYHQIGLERYRKEYTVEVWER